MRKKVKKPMLRYRRLIILLFVEGLLAASVPAERIAQQSDPPSKAPSIDSQDQSPAAPAKTPAGSQQKQDIIRINTQLVQVDVVVTDKKDRHVEDLTLDDFELLVDGRKQNLSHFSHINLPKLIARELPAKKKNDSSAEAPQAMPARQIDPSEVRRTIAFIVDDLGLSFTSTNMVRETLKTFVAEQMQEGDLVAIIRTGNGLGMLEQYTSDKRILYSAIDKLMWNPLSRDMSPQFDDSTAETSDDQSERQAVLDAFEEFRTTTFSTGTLGAVSFVVQGLRNLPGRKSVILLSDGFKVYSQDNDNDTNLIMQAMQDLVEQASRSSVVIYAMDAKGLQPYMPGASVGGRPSVDSIANAQQSAQEALDGPSFLATQTGGFIVTNTNDLNVGIHEALYDQQSYYLLGFDPDDETFDRRYHTIKVRVTRPGLKVRTRSGYFGEADSEKSNEPPTRGQQILGALMSPFGKRNLSVRMTPYFFNSAKEGQLVRTLFHIDPSKLEFKDGPDGRKSLNLELAAFAFDEKGAAVDVLAHRIKLSFNEQQYRRVMANGLAYRRDFPLKKPGAYQFRAVLRDDESGNTGTAGHFIQVPDLSKKRLATSGLVLTAPRVEASTPASDDKADKEAAVVAADSQPPVGKDAAADAHNSGLPASPYVRIFPRTGWIQYGAAIYNAATDKKTGKPQITVRAEIYRDGKPAYQFAPRAVELSPGANPQHFDYVGRLKLNNFPEGDYLLRLIVTDSLASKKYSRAEQWMDFSVR
jgi:VWFA-related protein